MNDSMRAQRFYADTGTVVIESSVGPEIGAPVAASNQASCGLQWIWSPDTEVTCTSACGPRAL